MVPRNNRTFSSVAWLFVILLTLGTLSGEVASSQPYPASKVITGIEWHWDTYQTAALGSDLWPVTWGPDNNLYFGWGDGGGFAGSDSDGRVSLGFARVEGGPEQFHGFNVNGGKNPEHPSSFPKKGKSGGVIFDHGILYANINLQDGKWPEVNHVLAWSADNGATWSKCDWLFPKGVGNFQPARFLNFGKNGDDVPDYLASYIYLSGVKQATKRGESDDIYIARAARDRIREHDAFQFFSGVDAQGQSSWNKDFSQARPIFTDTNGVAPAGMVYNPGLGRFLLTSYHTGPGQLGIFESQRPWVPWSTIAYYENWGQMGAAGEGLSCEFPQKWMSADGSVMWSVFSVYGDGAKQGIKAHDRFNLIKVSLSIAESAKQHSTP